MSGGRRHIVEHPGLVQAADRQELLGQRGVVVWLTGLSGSGKSTIAYGAERELIASGHAAFVLDGDNVRHALCRDLGFSPEERSENVRRVGEVAALFADAGLLTLVSLISPYRSDRRIAREACGAARFVEVHVEAPLSTCEKRDPKGLYTKARAGEISGFTGIDAPYEAPEKPDLVLHTDREDVAASVARLVDHLTGRDFLRPGPPSSRDDEAARDG